MQSYVYQAKNSANELLRGQIAGENIRSVAAKLKSQARYPVKIRKLTAFERILFKDFSTSTKVSVLQLSIVTHQLAMLLKSGLKLIPALQTVSAQVESKNMADILSQLVSDVEASSSFSSALKKFPKTFSPTYIATIQSAEKSGNLSKVLFDLSLQLKNTANLRSKVLSALMYPVFLALLSIIVVAILSLFVVPKFIELFVMADQALPLPTKILVGSTSFIKNCLGEIFISLTIISVLIFDILQNHKVKMFIHTFLLKTPVIGKIIRSTLNARFSYTLGSLLTSSVNIITALKTSANTISNPVYNFHLQRVTNEITKGSSLSQAMRDCGFFDKMLINMVNVGQQSGNLGKMLHEAGEIYEHSAQQSLDKITTILGPVMMLLLGGFVGFVVLAILLPVFETSTIIN